MTGGVLGEGIAMPGSGGSMLLMDMQPGSVNIVAMMIEVIILISYLLLEIPVSCGFYSHPWSLWKKA